MITNSQKEKIAIETIKTLYCQIGEIIEDINCKQIETYTNAFLNSLFDQKSGNISFNSWINGLNANLGKTFFQETAHILSSGQEKTFSRNSINNLQKQIITSIVTKLQNNESIPNLQKENEMIFSIEKVDSEIEAHDFTADIFWEDDEEVVAIETKAAISNNDFPKIIKSKMLEAKVILKKFYPNKEVKFFYGFPFDFYTSSSTDSDKKNFMSKNANFVQYFAEDEILIASEFWNYLSGNTQTTETILSIINSIVTIDFYKEFDFLQGRENAVNRKDEYTNLLEKWHLKREKQIVENQDEILSKISDDKTLVRIFNQNTFNMSGEYNEYRFQRLKDYL